MKGKTELDIYDILMKEIYTSCYLIQDIIHIPSFRIANLLCYGDHFSNTTLIDAKTKYKSLYLF